MDRLKKRSSKRTLKEEAILKGEVVLSSAVEDEVVLVNECLYYNK